MPKSAAVKVNVTIDGVTMNGDPNQTIMDVAKSNGVDIPTLCFNPFSPQGRNGTCRICVVEILKGGRPGLQPSCTFPISAGLEISTRSDAVYKSRRMTVELMLSEHVQDCRNCPASGNCTLAKLCKDYDINGVSVCSECPNQGEACFLARGILCLGPLTHSGCDAFCTRKGYYCEGCHSLMVNEDVLAFGLKAYKDNGFTAEKILSAADLFSYDDCEVLRCAMVKAGMMKEAKQ